MFKLNFAVICALFLSFNANADQRAIVKKADGSVAVYKLLPVHHDPSHAREVESRIDDVRSDLPEKYYIPKDLLPPTRDQGQRGTCVYFATVGMLETYLNILSPENKKLKVSEQCLVGLRNWEADTKEYVGDDKPTDFRPDPDGDYLPLVAKTVGYYGVPLAGKYPVADCRYNEGDSKPLSLEKYESLFSSGASPVIGKGNSWDVDSAPTIDKIKLLLTKNIPVEIATLVYRDHFSTPDWTYDPMKMTDSTLAGGHAIILTGYRSSGSKTVFTFKNSWGLWGNRGYGTIDSKLLKHNWSYDPEYDVSVSYHE
jgi:hypothetical protein